MTEKTKNFTVKSFFVLYGVFLLDASVNILKSADSSERLTHEQIDCRPYRFTVRKPQCTPAKPRYGSVKGDTSSDIIEIDVIILHNLADAVAVTG